MGGQSGYTVGMAGVLLLLIAAMHREGSLMARPYRFFGVLIAGGVLVPLSYAEFIVLSLHHDPAKDGYIAGYVLGAIGVAAALAVVLLQRRHAAGDCPDFCVSKNGTVPFDAAAILSRQWLPIGLLLLFTGLCFWTGWFSQYDPQHVLGYCGDASDSAEKWSPHVLPPFPAVNVAMIALALWLMRLRAQEDRTWPFTVGVLYFLLWAMLRYVDLFAGVGGMLGAALMFSLCGVGLFAVARFWIHRKEADHV